ncbi:MAG: cobalamin biosynthesis protein CbiX [Desulfobacterales bacterium]|nr:cobalamin biosynthesis protein CbiX [Desulfobacterales bacterium]
MKALLIISHGSRRQESNDEVRILAEIIYEKTKLSAKTKIDKVSCAFLELTTPLINTAVSDLSNEGVKEIFIFPFFLGAGNHVAKDIPKLVASEKDKYPDISFKIITHLGAVKGISDLILDEVERNQ